MHIIYEVEPLKFRSSRNLFCLYAFQNVNPEIGYEELIIRAVNYAKGIPLALKVLGSFLRGKSIQVWESELERVEVHSNEAVDNVLIWSFDKLRNSDKTIFLDIAFFFKGEDKDEVTCFLGSCGSGGIDNLQRKALISISGENRIEMHDLIEQMGLEIVYNESPNDLKKRSRLRNPEDVRSVLENSEGEKSVEGIVYDLSQSRDLHLNADTFRNMPHLRFLKLYAPWDQRQCNVYLPTTLEPFSSKLRYLEWRGYPLNSLPSRFCAENLVVLRLPGSQISKLWDGEQDLPNLTELDLHECKMLVELPDLSKATKLEFLNLGGCIELKSVKSNICLKYLKTLFVYGCSSLKEFSVSSEKLSSLDSSFSRIKNLTNDLCNFMSLQELSLRNCTELIELPHNIKALSKLNTLNVSGCSGLRSIPEIPPSVEVLYADDCTSLETIFSLKAVFSLNRRRISFANCVRLEEESLNDIIEDFHLTIFRNVLLWSPDPNGFMHFYLYQKMLGGVCYPGCKVPKWFEDQTGEASITIELRQPYYQLLGFFFCCVVSLNLPSYYFEAGITIKCEYYFGDGIMHPFVTSVPNLVRETRWISDHVLILTSPFHSEEILYEIKQYRGSGNDDSTCNQKISFKFSVNRPEGENDEDCFIKGCGVIPMYASTLLDAIQKLEESNLNPQDNLILDLDEVKSMMIEKINLKPTFPPKDPDQELIERVDLFLMMSRGVEDVSDSEEESCSHQEEE